MSKYAVVISFNFDSTVSVLLFDTKDEAKKFIRKDLEEELWIDCVENGWDNLTTSWVSDDGHIAKLYNSFDDHENITEWRLADVHEVPNWWGQL